MFATLNIHHSVNFSLCVALQHTNKAVKGLRNFVNVVT